MDRIDQVHGHRSGRIWNVDIGRPSGSHDDGDQAVTSVFARALRGESGSIASACESVKRHLMVLAEGRSWLQGTVVDMDVFSAEAVEARPRNRNESVQRGMQAPTL